jgi:uncharacterized protein YfiM (DUF2279 family)
VSACVVLTAAVILSCNGVPRDTLPEPVVAPDRWLAEDKLRHFTLSFAATHMAYGAARTALEPHPATAGAAALATLLGVGKELVDRRTGGPFSTKDLIWDVAGVALGVALVQRIH